MTYLKYKDYLGSVEFDGARMTLRGKLLFITDLVTFETVSVPEIQKEFEAAVDDYLQTCAALGREPHKTFSDIFNVCIEPK